MPQPSYHDRYLQGEHVQVWQELSAIGPAVRTEPLLEEALLVCREIVRRAHHNLRLLHQRLIELGYQFAEEPVALVDAGPAAPAKLAAIEQELGTLPLIARVWYETIASVDFRQADAQRSNQQEFRPYSPGDIYGLGSHPVLVFQSLDRCRAEWLELAAENEEFARHVAETGRGQDDLNPFGPFLPLGGWASNCEPKGFNLPSLGVDDVIYDDGGGPITFVEELRRAFRWGGFPFWRWSLSKSDFYSPFEYRPDFARLLPILREGLVEL